MHVPRAVALFGKCVLHFQEPVDNARKGHATGRRFRRQTSPAAPRADGPPDDGDWLPGMTPYNSPSLIGRQVTATHRPSHHWASYDVTPIT